MTEREYQRRLALLLEELARAKTQRERDDVELKMQALDRQANGSNDVARTGFICPDWAKPHWNPRECTVMTDVSGEYVVVDHSVHETVYVGKDANECHDWLSRQM